jgi:hypothetical protein
MNKYFSMAVLIWCFYALQTKAQTIVNREWTQNFGVPDPLATTTSCLDYASNVIIAASDFVQGQDANISFIKYNHDRNIIWQNSFNGVSNGKDYGEMHIIVADNIFIAKNKLYKYLKKNTKAENIIIDTHGGGAGWIYLDNLNGTHESSKNYYSIDDLKLLKKSATLVRRNILSLKMIIEKVKQYGNAIFLGCAMAKGKKGIEFMKEIHKFNYKTNTYVSEAFNIGSLQPDLQNLSYYSSGENEYYECINWNDTTQLASGGIHNDKINQGYKLMEARSAKYVDLSNIGNYSGNLLINGYAG